MEGRPMMPYSVTESVHNPRPGIPFGITTIDRFGAGLPAVEDLAQIFD